MPKRLEDGWTKEPLADEPFKNGDVAVTLEGMCVEITASDCLRNDGNGMHLDPTKLSASTWQETLANVWRVFGMHQRHQVGVHSLAQSTMKVTTGLKVKDALIAIQKEVVSTTDNDVGDADAVEAKRVLIEVCITGSLYIVGSALEAAGWEEGEALGSIC